MSILKVQYFGFGSDNFTEPTIANSDDAGYDLYSAETILIVPNTCEGINCKISTAIPRGYFGKIYSRSSLVKHNFIIAEGGIIDSGYRGDWFVILFNHGKKCFTVKPGDKIAQVVFMKKETVEFVRVKDYCKLGETERGKSGFGSSGSKKRKIEFSDFESQPLPEDEPEDESKDEPEVLIVEDAVMAENGSIIISEKSISVE